MAAATKAGVNVSEVLDVGSSVGCLLASLGEETGLLPAELLGIDYGRHVRRNFLKSDAMLFVHDLESGQVPKLRSNGFSMVNCQEVAEHLKESCADDLVRVVVSNLSSKGILVFSAAGPGQRGTHHVNCQPFSYWGSKFSEYGWIEDKQITALYEDVALDVDPSSKGYTKNTRCFLMAKDYCPTK